MFKRLVCTNYDNLLRFSIRSILRTSCVPTFFNDQTKTKTHSTLGLIYRIESSVEINCFASNWFTIIRFSFLITLSSAHCTPFPADQGISFIYFQNKSTQIEVHYNAKFAYMRMGNTIYWMKAGQMVINRFFSFAVNILSINQNQKFNRE